MRRAFATVLAESLAERRDVAGLLALAADDADCSVAAQVALLYGLPADLGARLARRGEACVRVALARNPFAPAAVLARLAADGADPCPHRPDREASDDVRTAVAGNPNAPWEAVEAGPPLALAARRDLPADLWDDLVATGEQRVIVQVAMNWAAPADLLRRLYDEDDGRWRSSVLANPRTPLDLLIRHSRAGKEPNTGYHPDVDGLCALAGDPDPRVRLVAAASHRIPPPVRATLIDDPDLDVATRAVRDVSVSPDQVRAMAARRGPVAYPVLAGHPSAPPDVLLAIAAHAGTPLDSIFDVAIHDAATPEALAACLRRPAAAAGVAGNPAASAELLLDLAGHPDPEVRLEVARNPGLTAAAADRLIT